MNPRHADGDAVAYLWDLVTSNPFAALAVLVAVTGFIAFAVRDHRRISK